MKKILGTMVMFLSVGCSELGTEPSLTEESLEGGQWIASCIDNYSSWETRKAQYDGTNYVESVEAFADSYCNNPAFRLQEDGVYTIPGKIEGSSMRKLDRTVASIKLTPLSALGVSNLNSSSFCGFSDWAVNVPREISGLTCNGQVIPAGGTTYYDLFTIWPYSIDDPYVGITKGDLNFGYRGGGMDGMTEETRPDSVTNPDFKRHPL